MYEFYFLDRYRTALKLARDANDARERETHLRTAKLCMALILSCVRNPGERRARTGIHAD